MEFLLFSFEAPLKLCLRINEVLLDYRSFIKVFKDCAAYFSLTMFLKTFNFKNLRNIASPSSNLVRNYAMKSDLKVKWIRPLRVPCYKPEKSGDLKAFECPDQKRFILNFEKSEELKTANELVKNMFTLEQNGRRESVEILKKETVDLVKRHDLDNGSLESKSKLSTFNYAIVKQL